MKHKIKLMPAIMTVLSALYFFYVLSSEDTTLTADAVGGDPGGKVLPLAMAVFMFCGFLYLTIKERPSGEKMDPQTKRLFLTTLVLSVLYVLLIRSIGFIILSSILLYSLEYLYSTAGKAADKKKAVIGGLVTVGATVAAFIIMRTITRVLMSLGRAGALPGIFASATFEAGISLVYVVLIAFVLVKTVRKKFGRGDTKDISGAGLLTLVAVLFLYVVFKQFFSVNLAAGILDI